MIILSLPVIPMVGISGKFRLSIVGLHTGVPHRLEPLLEGHIFRAR
jgi:hypothetical protein